MSDLSSVERLKIEALFGMESGYVLGFSNNTFSIFTVTNIGIDIFDSKYEYGSSSKANRLRKFWLEEANEVVGKLLSALLDYWLAQKQINGDELSPKEKTLYDECQKIVGRLNQDAFRQTQENTSSPSQKRGIFSNGTDMSESKRPLKVFLCHAHADRDSVYDLYARLTQDGVDAWLDKAKLLPGQDWELEIRKAVREADVVVVCLSKQFNQAGFRQKEVRLALDTAMEKPEGEIFIIPARLEECDTLESLRHLHWVNIFEESGYDELSKALSLRAKQVNAIFAREFVLKPETGVAILVGQPATLSNLGLTHQNKGDFSKAIEYFEMALVLSRGMGDKKSEAVIISNLGSAYAQLGDLVRATKLYEQAIEINNELGVTLKPRSLVTELEKQKCENIVFTYQDMPSRTRSHGLRVMVENRNPRPIVCRAFLVEAYSPAESINKYLLSNNFYWVDDSLDIVIERKIEPNRFGTFLLADINTKNSNDEYLYFVMQEKVKKLVKRFRGLGEYSVTVEVQGAMEDVKFICPVITVSFNVSLNDKGKRFIRTTQASIPKGA